MTQTRPFEPGSWRRRAAWVSGAAALIAAVASGAPAINPDPDLFDGSRTKRTSGAAKAGPVHRSDPWEKHLVVIPHEPSTAPALASQPAAPEAPPSVHTAADARGLNGVFRDRDGTLITVRVETDGRVTVAVEGDDEPPGVGRITAKGAFAVVVSDDPTVPMRVTMDGRLVGDDLELTMKMTGGPQSEEVVIKREIARRVEAGWER